jgi:N-acetylmuramoyl-L-alanine amidase
VGPPSVPIRLLLALLLAVVAVLGAGAVRAERPAVVDVRLGQNGETTRFVLELAEPAAFRIAVLADPYRIVLNGPALDWAAGALAGRGAVAAVAGDPDAGRIVLDLLGPVEIVQAFALPPQDGRRHRLVLDLRPTGVGAFGPEERRIAVGTSDTGPPVAQPPVPQPPVPQPPVAATPVSTLRVPAEPLPTRANRIAPGGRPSTERGPSRRVVVVDAGHGGVDPGAIAVTGMHEKEVTLQIARALRTALEATGRYRVVMTRDADVFLALRDRVAIARDAKADLFVSLHADSIDRGTVRGLSVYTLSDQASDREAAQLAARENRADALAGVDLARTSDQVARVLVSMAQRHTLNQSRRLANQIVETMRGEFPLIPQPHRSAGFAVLTAPDVPAVLVEMGYLSSPQDARLLATGAHQQRLARSIARAVDRFFAPANVAIRP